MATAVKKNSMRATVLVTFAVAMTAMAQDAPQQAHRIILPLPKTALTETASAQPPANPVMHDATTDPGAAAAATPAGEGAGNEVTPNMEAARAAVAALNRAAAASNAAVVNTPAQPAAVQPDGAAGSTRRVYSAPGDSLPVYNAAANVATPVAVTPAAAMPMAAVAVSSGSGEDGYAAHGGAEMMHNFDSSQPEEQMLHVAVGHSMYVNTKHRLTRVYVTDPAVLNSYTSSPNQIVVTALKAGTSTVMVWDESGQSEAYMVSADSNFGALQQALKTAFPADSIEVRADEDRALLTGYAGTQADVDAAGKLAMQFTKNVSNSIVVNSSRVKQVRLKVRIVEVDRSKLAQFGFNFFAAGGKNVGTTTTGAFPSTIANAGGTVTVSNPLNFSYFNSQYNVGVTLQDLANMNVAQILAEPTITTMSGVKASFLAGGEFPFPVVQAGGSSTAPTVTVEFRPYGVKLDFLPRVNPDGTVDLKVNPEVSALDFSNAVNIAGYTIPALSTRRADTQMVLQDGQSFAISGLLDQRTTDALGRTPGISSIPILGELFKSKNVNHSVEELIVIVTPTIVDPLAQAVDTSVDQPQIVVPMLKPQKFDKELPKSETKQ
jgi:pilus assembly protein CpaC